MVFLALAAVCVVSYLVLRRRDRRMLRNGALLLAALFFGVLGVTNLAAARFPAVEVLIVGAILLFPVGMLVLAGFLVANGVRMLRREQRSVGNMLSMVAGVGLVCVLVLLVVVARSHSTVGEAALLLVLAVGGYAGLVFAVFLLYALVYGHVRTPRLADVIVVLGSGLVRGQVPPLLRSRLDKSIEVFRYSTQQGRDPIVIPSGGQGPDEPTPEGAAMGEYLREQGVPEEAIRPETRSRNTDENLRFSRAVQESASVTGTVLVVTSNYHVMRAAMLARRVGSAAQVVGAPTARYYVPSAFLREFAAVVAAHRATHAVALVVVVVFWAYVVVTELI